MKKNKKNIQYSTVQYGPSRYGHTQTNIYTYTCMHIYMYKPMHMTKYKDMNMFTYEYTCTSIHTRNVLRLYIQKVYYMYTNILVYGTVLVCTMLRRLWW